MPIKGAEVIEGEICPDHIHMLVSIPPKMSVSGFMGYLKGKSSLMICQKRRNMKLAYRNREIRSKGYYVDRVGKNERINQEYIRKRLEEDNMHEQIGMKEHMDPLTGSKNK